MYVPFHFYDFIVYDYNQLYDSKLKQCSVFIKVSTLICNKYINFHLIKCLFSELSKQVQKQEEELKLGAKTHEELKKEVESLEITKLKLEKEV